MEEAPARTVHRDVFFADVKDPTAILGGLVLTAGVTNANFHTMLDIVLEMAGPSSVQTQCGEPLARDPSPLLPGTYLIVADCPVTLSQETFFTRAQSPGTTGQRGSGFTNQVRERDGGCVVRKMVNPSQPHLWIGFSAAHIFPIAHQETWIAGNFDQYISLPPTTGKKGINSVQNGLLLDAGIHQMFNAYLFSIDPDVSLLYP